MGQKITDSGPIQLRDLNFYVYIRQIQMCCSYYDTRKRLSGVYSDKMDFILDI
jgi:hypothetical protein